MERIQAALFVDVYRHSGERSGSGFWQGTASLRDLQQLVTRFVGRDRCERAFEDYAKRRDLNLNKMREADADLIQFTERLLAGSIGAASARVMVASVAKGEITSIDEVMEILDEASHVIEYSHQLEQKSQELELASRELRAANERLQELDRLKDEFLSIVSHELRTPLTSIRSFSEILFDNPDLELEERTRFLGIIIKESERLTRLINDILDLAKMQAGRQLWRAIDLDPGPVIEDAVASLSGLLADRRIELQVNMAEDLPQLHVDRDGFFQVIVNLLSNAAKFSDQTQGQVTIGAEETDGGIEVRISDNGLGIPEDSLEAIFEKFQQGVEPKPNKPEGTGLGLAICRQIIEEFSGRIWAESPPGEGATLAFWLPVAAGARSVSPEEEPVPQPRLAAQPSRESVPGE